MTASPSGSRSVEIDADLHDLLARTATTRGTDINGALRNLLEVPSTPAAPPSGDEDDE